MVQHGLLTEFDADTLQTQAQAANIGFVEQILVSKKMSSAQVAVFASRAFGAPLLDLTGFDFDLIDKELVDAKIAATRRVLPLQKRGNRLFVAVSDPANLQALDEVRFKTNLVVDPVVVEDDKLGKAIEKASRAATSRPTRKARRSRTPPSLDTSRRYCSTRLALACPTYISSLTRSSTASAIDWTAS